MSLSAAVSKDAHVINDAVRRSLMPAQRSRLNGRSRWIRFVLMMNCHWPPFQSEYGAITGVLSITSEKSPCTLWTAAEHRQE